MSGQEIIELCTLLKAKGLFLDAYPLPRSSHYVNVKDTGKGNKGYYAIKLIEAVCTLQRAAREEMAGAKFLQARCRTFMKGLEL